MLNASDISPVGVGLEYQAPRDIRRDRPVSLPAIFDYVEIQPPHVIADPGLLDAFDRRTILHVSHLSLGSIGIPMDAEYLRLTCRLLERTGSPWMSEHMSWNRFPGGDTRHFVLPFLGEEVVEAIVGNAVRLRRITGLPVLLENAPRTFAIDMPGDQSEGEFIRTILDRADAGLLLDIESARATADRLGQCVHDYLRTLPLERTIEIHVGDLEADLDILHSILDVAPVRAVTLGWDMASLDLDGPLARIIDDLRRRIGSCPAASPSIARATQDGDASVCLAPGVAVSLRDSVIRVTGGARAVQADLPQAAMPLLSHFSTPQPLSSAFLLGPDTPAVLGETAAWVGSLLHAGALVPAEEGARVGDGWGAWGSWDAARDFYMATRTGTDTHFKSTAEIETDLVDKASSHRQPSAYKDYWAHPFIPLPDPLQRDPEVSGPNFLDVLLRRRTIRSFGPGRLSQIELSWLLFYVWGAVSVEPNYLGDVFLRKTSPSGGSLQGVEVYPLLLNVEGFDPGLYHYSVRRHGLVLLSRDDPRSWIGQACGNQEWVAGAGALFLSTVNVERLTWKYDASRVFRAALLEAGHFGQTFALMATYLGLAPFTTAALRDELIEERLGLDYRAEPIVMLNGVGCHDATLANPDRPRS